MTIGTVKWFSTTKGYGFIKPDNDNNDVFVHISELEKAHIKFLKENDKVEFEIKKLNGKSSAVDLKLMK